MGCVIPQENGNTIGCTHADADVGNVGGKGIDPIEGECLLKRILVQELFVDNDGLGLMRLMEWHEESRNVDRNTAISSGGEGGDMGGSRVDVHGEFVWGERGDRVL